MAGTGAIAFLFCFLLEEPIPRPVAPAAVVEEMPPGGVEMAVAG
jgi:hypothetical protein